MEFAPEAGATEDAIAPLMGDIEAAKQDVADTGPLGARLDAARAQLAKAEATVLAAEAAVAQAIERCNEAKAWRENAAASWSRLQQEVPRESFCLEPLVQGARNLLAQLEQSWVADPSTGQMPERILAGMKELHDALAASAPEQLPTWTYLLLPETTQVQKHLKEQSSTLRRTQWMRRILQKPC